MAKIDVGYQVRVHKDTGTRMIHLATGVIESMGKFKVVITNKLGRHKYDPSQVAFEKDNEGYNTYRTARMPQIRQR